MQATDKTKKKRRVNVRTPEIMSHVQTEVEAH